MATRYAASGFNKAVLIPRCQTSGNLLDFYKSHRTKAQLAAREQLHKQLGYWVEEDTGGKESPFATDFSSHENESVFQNSPRVADRCKIPTYESDLILSSRLFGC